VQGDEQVLTTREAVTVATGSGSCAACHSVINPLGFVFEHYDSIGAWQDFESGEAPDGSTYELPVDSAADVRIPAGDFEVVPISDAVELSFLLAEDPHVRRCVASRWFGHAFGRAPSRAEQCALEEELEPFYTTSELRDLISGLVQSDTFQLTRAAE
ncbi:MAG: DUF1588 domain-containing protein, partial [Myxococcota bacterium]